MLLISIKTHRKTSFDLCIGYQAHTPDAGSTSGLIACNTMLLQANIIWLEVTTVSQAIGIFSKGTREEYILGTGQP